MVAVDASETARLSEAIEAVVRALEAFNRFQGPDLAGREESIWRSALDRPVPRSGAGLDAVLRELTQTIIPHGLRVGDAGFSGWMAVAPTTSGTAAALAGTVAGPQRWWVQPFNFLETVALRWLAELLELPGDMQGTFTSGGSVANLIGLGAARQRVLEKHAIDPARDGLPADMRFRIYASDQVHHVVIRAAGVLGLGRSSVVRLPVDRDQRMDLAELRKALESDRADGVIPVALVASAGTVNTGAIDPIDEMVELAAEFESWLHVDGAYGLFGKLDPRLAPLYRGLDKADSLVVDPHKWLAAPVGCGAAFVRDRALLGRAFTTVPADYLEGAASTGEVSSPFDHFGELYHNFNVEQSAPSRGVQVWAILREIGVDGLRERIIRHNDFARRLASRVKDDEHLELLAEPTLSICCFRYRRPDMEEAQLEELNAEIARRLRAEGEYVPSTTRVASRFAIRPAYINPRTTVAEVDGLADRVRRIGDELAGPGGAAGEL